MKLLVNIDVDDIEAAVTFYTQALGLRLGRRLDNRFIELTGASSRIYLLQEKKQSPAVSGLPVKRNYKRHWTPVHLDFVVKDIKKSIRQAVKAGAKLEGRIRKESYGYLANLSDPFGHGFCFIQFLGRGYDTLIEEMRG